MERHKCKLCSRTFANGKALGGHMKAHLATLPLPPKPQPPLAPSFSHSSSSSSSSSSEEEAMANRGGESDEKSLIYVLRENPKKSLRLSDPELSSPASVVIVQDRESETESKKPTRRRSKRTRKPCSIHIHQNSEQEQKKPKLSLTDSPTDPEPVSSVSNTSPEEDVAMCLMMLSRDTWKKNDLFEEEEEEEVQRSSSVEKSKGLRKVRGKQQCDNCGKTFRSSRALGSHKSICFIRDDEAEGTATASHKIFQCPFCPKVFGSGQALGGHKRSHLYPSPSIKDTTLIIDLNLPATPEEEEENDVDLSVVSDA